MPRVPYDYANERPSRSVREHALSIADRLGKSWLARQCYLDVPWYTDGGEDAAVGTGAAALAAIVEHLRDSVHIVPVVSTSQPAEYLSAIKGLRHSDAGVCVRLSAADFDEDGEIEPAARVDQLLNAVGRQNAAGADLILDLGDVGADPGRGVLLARAIIGDTPRAQEWRRLTVAGASFPENLSEVDAATTTALPRVEWAVWLRLQRRRGALREGALFGDYGIANPIPTELDPRTMRMSASIRYTTATDWLVLKGRNVRQYGFDQYYKLCETLVTLTEFSGENFSWGDRLIARCARRQAGPGNATTWRKVGTNHHLTLVAEQLSNGDVP